jgi:hypothetical protein
MPDILFEGLWGILFLLSWVVVRQKKRSHGGLDSVLRVHAPEPSTLSDADKDTSTAVSAPV